ncbi:calcium-translocating P-type ATPase, PMCA-type [Clostridium fallax]|uniref:P-type Ca(2+) transporter n=1 Tax=Clostridium fallax TaxID=1533 RepID=A0A1M4TXZ9_9CLOT|nr:calcium-translocating P-type ATPase, PMCA-type [Clostridium fallax]SHE49335.1 Ca2+-transporting ATPase [Clostridium fallax]SQB22337.1 P-type ATPase, translocating [Clostridium fallax]
MDSFLRGKEEVLKDLKVDETQGLSDVQIEEMRKTYGKNEFLPGKKQSLVNKIIEALKDPMVLILLGATIISIGMNIYKMINGGHTEFGESIGILLAVTLSVGIQIIMEGKSEKAFDQLNNINEDIKVKVIRNGKIQYIFKKEVVVGDIVLVETGDKIPADGRLLEDIELNIDESMLTGESDPVKKDGYLIITSEKTPLAERVNMVYSGTFVTSGRGTYIVTEVGDNTEMGHIAKELKETNTSSTPLQEKLGVLAKRISIVGAAGAVLVFVFECFKIMSLGGFSFDRIQEAFMTSIALIVACVPEGLPTIVAMIFAFNVVKMAKNNALVKKMVACETIGSTNVICSDKTGTLTKNQMTVMKVWCDNLIEEPKKLKNINLIDNFAINSTANLQMEDGKEKFIGNPTECSLLKALKKINIDYCNVRKEKELIYQYSFSSEKKSMTSIISNDNEYIAFTKGSPEKVLAFCKFIELDGKIIELDYKIQANIEKEIKKLQNEAYRIIGFSHKNIKDKLHWEKSQDNVEENMIYDGFVAIADPLRDEVYEAVQKCKRAGISLKILTGDNIVTATAIARQLNILKEDSIILEANDIDEMNDYELEKVIDKITVIARSKPITKMRVVKLLKKLGNVVAVTGDGINDAPALRNADVGISMGINGTEVSKEASDIVLLDDSFSTIVKAVEWGRGIYENLQRFLQFQLTVNLVAVVTIILSEIFGFKLPFTPVQLLWVNIIMDGPPALSLGLESLRKNLMDKKPVKRDASIITREMVFKIISNGIYMIIMLIALQSFKFLGGTLGQQETIVFSVFVLFQLFNAFNSRELGNESIISCLGKNKVMVISVLCTFVAHVLIVQFAGAVFGTVPLTLGLWIKVIVFSATIILYSEIVKALSRSFEKATEVKYE